ncbi:SusC/RagA family TonB-linked outer membrane protein [Arcicella lustrica]|uniref:TonB-dependent receptor n=1 Tax=Arcicella lustrica TaxID=2984196 RepID=A0ABU5SFF5_9BACT|nr:TonB-dependent receptor [Arcicella sp. DC25W]MEA5425991.1 TonB-dependent receptor [Arcicella sp. DC25W]
MKLSFQQFLIAVLFTSMSFAHTSAQTILEKKISLHADKRDMKSVLKSIEHSAGIRFTYIQNLIPSDKVISANFSNEKLAVILDNLLKPYKIDYEVTDKYIILSKQLSDLKLMQMKDFDSDFRQNLAITITGKVVDDRGEPLPGVTIKVKDTSKGTATDGKGEYKIAVPDAQSVLTFSFVGYLPQDVIVGNRSIINVTLAIDNVTLSEIVVVGYGTQDRRDVTGAVATIKTQNIKDLPVTSVDQKLAGQVAGVQVSQVSGTPGSGPVIRIRGSGSIGAGDDPLYVLDGFPMTNYYSKTSNPLSTISPDDIESISILKDASSTAIYGSRGSNGVVLITTKHAKNGATNIEFNVYTGIQTVSDRNRVQVMSASEFAQNRIDAAQGLAAIKGQAFDINTVAEAYRNPSSIGAGTNWFNAMSRNAPMQNYNLTITKGTENLRSMVSLGYFNQQGVLLNTDFQRFSIRGNIDANISKKITVGLNISPSFTIRHLAETEGHFNTAIVTQSYLNSPFPSVYQADGSFTPNITSAGFFNNANPVNMLVNTTNYGNNIRTLANTYLGIEILPNLKFLTTFNTDLLIDTQDKFTPSTVGGFRNPPPTLATGSNYSARTFNWLSENTLTYSHSIKEHRFTALVGYSAQKEIFKSTTVNGNGYADDVIQTINSAIATGVSASAGGGKGALLSYLARATYAYKDKYLFNATVRRDGSSKFGLDNRWGTFPSASVGWRVSEEKFFPKSDIVDDLKLRVSYGLAGNNNIGNFTAQKLLGLDNYVFGGKIVTGQAINSLGNTNLGWEQSKQTDIGLDASLLKGKLNLIIELYERFTESMLQSIDIPSSSGFNSTITNLGNVRNQGLEISLSSRNINKGKFHWDTDFNISFNRNKVISLGNRTRIQSGDNGSVTMLGEPMGLFFGYKMAGGFFNTVEDLTKYPRASVQTIGSIRFEDINKDGKIDGNDQTVIGSPYPNFIWGMTNRVSYGNFDFSMLINGSQGGQILDFYKRFLYNQDGVFNLHKDVINAYKDINNQGTGRIQSAGSALAGDSFSRNTSDAWVMDGSYMVVRNITLGYNFKPKKYFKGLRAYVSGQNLFTVSSYTGSFPEVGFNGSNSLAPGVNYGSYPVAATYTLGVNCKF